MVGEAQGIGDLPHAVIAAQDSRLFEIS